jgi:hypothetical protein
MTTKEILQTHYNNYKVIEDESLEATGFHFYITVPNIKVAARLLVKTTYIDQEEVMFFKILNY